MTKKEGGVCLLGASSSAFSPQFPGQTTPMLTQNILEGSKVGGEQSENATVTQSPAAYWVIWGRAPNKAEKKRNFIESGSLTSRGDIELVIDKKNLPQRAKA